MFRTIDPRDKRIRPFRVHKKFTFTNFSTGSGVYPIRGIVVDTIFISSSKMVRVLEHSINYHKVLVVMKKAKYSLGSFYSVPTYYMVKHLYYQSNRFHWSDKSVSFIRWKPITKEKEK